MRTSLIHSCIAWAAALALVFLGAGLPRSAGLVLCIGCHGDDITMGGACDPFEVDECCADTGAPERGTEGPLAGSGLPLNDCGCIDIPLTTDPTTPRDRAEVKRTGQFDWLLPASGTALSQLAARPGPGRGFDGRPPPRSSPLDRRTVLVL